MEEVETREETVRVIREGAPEADHESVTIEKSKTIRKTLDRPKIPSGRRTDVNKIAKALVGRDSSQSSLPSVRELEGSQGSQITEEGEGEQEEGEEEQQQQQPEREVATKGKSRQVKVVSRSQAEREQEEQREGGGGEEEEEKEEEAPSTRREEETEGGGGQEEEEEETMRMEEPEPELTGGEGEGGGGTADTEEEEQQQEGEQQDEERQEEEEEEEQAPPPSKKRAAPTTTTETTPAVKRPRRQPPATKQPRTQEAPTTTTPTTKKKKAAAPTKARSKPKKRFKQENVEGLEPFNTYVYRVLKQIHPGLGMSKRGMEVINDCLYDMYERLVREAKNLVQRCKKKTLSALDIQAATRLVLTGDLRKHAVAEATQALTRSHASITPTRRGRSASVTQKRRR